MNVDALLGLVVAAIVVVVLLEVWCRDRGALWAVVGFPTGLTWCICTATGSWFTVWQPDLGPLPHGTGYLLGAAVAVVTCGITIHR